MPRIATCGGFRIGVDMSEPKTPPFVIVNVPPVNSSSVIEPSRARCAYEPTDDSNSAKPSDSALRMTGHHQTAIGRDRDADVVELVIHDVVAVDRRIDARKLAQRFDRCLDEERRVTELHAVRLFELLLVASANLVHRSEVDFVERRQHRGRRLRLNQALRDACTQTRHRNALFVARTASGRQLHRRRLRGWGLR